MINKTLSLALCLGVLVGGFQQSNALPRIEVHGNLRFDAQYNNRIPVFFPAVPFGSGESAIQPDDADFKNDHPQMLWDARLSQIDIKMWDRVCNIDCFGEIEIDFLGQTFLSTSPTTPNEMNKNITLVNGDARFVNGYLPRLRLGYLRLDSCCNNWFVIIGQYWSQFGSLEIGNPKLVDYHEGPATAGIARQPQIAVGYTWELDCVGHFSLIGSAEKQAFTRGSLDSVNESPPPFQHEYDGDVEIMPLWVAKASWLGFKPFQVETYVAYTEDRMVRNVNLKLYKVPAWGWGVVGQTGFKNISLYGGYRYLKGINRLGGFDFHDITFQNIGQFAAIGPAKMVAIRTYGWFAGGTWDITPFTSFSAVYGRRHAPEVPNSLFSSQLTIIDAFAKMRTLQVALLHSFWDQCKVGVEYKNYHVEGLRGRKRTLDIIASAFWYYF